MRIAAGIVLLVLLAPPCILAEDEAGTGSLVVVVTTEEGEAVGRAEIEVWSDESERTTATDDSGVAKLEGLPVAVYRISAGARGRTAAERHGVQVDAGLESRVELALEEGIPFAGLVLRADDTPMDSVYVEVRRGGTFEGYGESFADPTPYARTFTDPEGRFFVGGIPPERVATVVVQAEDYEEARVCVRAIGDAVRPHPLVIRLVKGGEVFGSVAGPDGRPVGDATVFVVPAGHEQLRENPRVSGWSSDGSSFAAWRARTDAEGRYRVAGLPLDDAYVVLADTARHARSAWSEEFRPTARRNSARIDLALRQPGTIRVRIRAPEGHEVTWTRAQLGGHLSGLDAEEGAEEGVVLFRALWPETHRLTVTARGFLTQQVPVELAEGATVDVDVLLDPGVAIRGVLVDENDRGVAGVRVEAEPQEADEEGWHESVSAREETDDEGRFLLGGLRPGRHELKARTRSFDLPEPVTVTAPATGVVLKGMRLGELSIRFVTPAGEPVTFSKMVWRRKPDGGGGGNAESAKDGVFHFQGFRGKERLTFDFDGFVRVEREVDIQPCEHGDLGTVTLEVGLTLEGRVVDSEGKPVAAAVVAHAGYTEATTGADGRFRLAHLPAGEIAVTIDAEGFLETERSTRADEKASEVVLVLQRGTRLEGVVTDETGEPLGDHWFRVERQDPTGAWHEDDNFATDDEGAFQLRVKAGPCRIAFYAERGKPPVVLATVDGQEGETRRLELVMSAGRTPRR